MNVARTFAPSVPATPSMDGLVDAQPRFRVEGSGPLSSRTISPASKAAEQLLEQAPAARDAVRGVLRLVEQVAGGAAASSAVDLNGVAFSTSSAGLAATTWRSLVDDDPALRSGLARLAPAEQAKVLDTLAERKRTETAGMLANVTSGWMNLGPAASSALLGRAGAPTATRPTQRQLADSVRILLHESVHAVDTEPANLPREAMHGMWEALAEARTMSMPQLQAARRTLGLDDVVPDSALAASLAHRPYAAAERVLDGVLRTARVAPGSSLERSLVHGTAHDAVDTLVARMARVNGTSQRSARDAIATAFAEAMRGAR